MKDAAVKNSPPGKPGATYRRMAAAPEQKVSGRNACRALFQARPGDVRRVHIVEENIRAFGDLLHFCSLNRIAYHVRTAEDLTKVSETVHHDGIVIDARLKPEVDLETALGRIPAKGPHTVVMLENVKNPHNLGAILRVCAHFGVATVLAAGETPALSPAAMRTAEGGAEFTDVISAGDGVQAIVRLRGAGLTVIATTSHTASVLGRTPLPGRTAVLFGAEGSGLSLNLMSAADAVMAIPGSGALESLNVACSASVFLWELFRQDQPRGKDGPGPRRRSRRPTRINGSDA